MAFRVSSSASSMTSPTRPGLSIARIERGIGALSLKRQEDLPLAKDYKGKAALLEFSFPAIPGLSGAIAAGIKGGTFVDPPVKARLLRIEVWQDTAPTFDSYDVKVWLAGEIPDSQHGATGTFDPKSSMLTGSAQENLGIGLLPLAAILSILLVVSVLVVLGVVSWKLSKLDFGKATKDVTNGLILLGIVGIGAWFVLKLLDRKAEVRRG